MRVGFGSEEAQGYLRCVFTLPPPVHLELVSVFTKPKNKPSQTAFHPPPFTTNTRKKGRVSFGSEGEEAPGFLRCVFTLPRSRSPAPTRPRMDGRGNP